MKKILGALVISLAMWTGVSFADANPGELVQREQAELTELMQGRAWNVYYKRILTSFGRAGHPVENFTFEEVNLHRNELSAAPVVIISSFRVVKIEALPCNSVLITAEEQTATGYPGRELRVVDHLTRSCDDAKPFRWEVELAGTTVRNFVGNPVPALTE